MFEKPLFNGKCNGHFILAREKLRFSYCCNLFFCIALTLIAVAQTMPKKKKLKKRNWTALWEKFQQFVRHTCYMLCVVHMKRIWYIIYRIVSYQYHKIILLYFSITNLTPLKKLQIHIMARNLIRWLYAHLRFFCSFRSLNISLSFISCLYLDLLSLPFSHHIHRTYTDRQTARYIRTQTQIIDFFFVFENIWREAKRENSKLIVLLHTFI